MHYIRLLRPPKLSPSQQRMQAELVFTITTDLGDSFLYPEAPVNLVVTAHVYTPSGDYWYELSEHGKLQWTPGRRVAKPVFELPPTVVSAMMSGDVVELCVGSESSFSADRVHSILTSAKDAHSQDGGRGLIMPVQVTLNGPDADDDISTRKIRLNATNELPEYLEIEEEIGESIARHIWDAGVVALSAMVATYKFPHLESSQHPCMQTLRRMFDSGESEMNILELGCGVGILGTGLCAVYPRERAADCTILMTDLDEAEGRARANIALLKHNHSGSQLGNATILYENLNWEHGRQGRFGPEVQRRRWDLVLLSDCTYNVDVLPALVGTLSALHEANAKQAGPAGGDARPSATRVFLATKPRHASEKALFALMESEGWRILESQVLPLPVLGAESESVEMYLFEKV
ncbi:vacuolar ATP synthase [Purpureocillium lavendulum]|uniref:Vacuolar ATP synthase n=1 Tax=Purpureocillium lavendulum TaxID=1247861 RepID=A0AB34FLC2_9HYPO|nr:vacuolar ATP synthase [Purpureocillium lavendulum]